MDTILEKEPVITNASIFSSYNDYMANKEVISKGNVSLQNINTLTIKNIINSIK